MIALVINFLLVVSVVLFFIHPKGLRKMWRTIFRWIGSLFRAGRRLLVRVVRWLLNGAWYLLKTALRLLAWFVPRFFKWLIIFIGEFIHFLFEAIRSLIATLSS